MDAAAWLYDGATAVRHDVTVRASGTRIEIDGFDTVDAALLQAVPSMDARLYGRSDLKGWRLGFDSDPGPEIAALLPGKPVYGRWIDRFGLWRAGAALAGLAVALIVVALQLPGWIAPYIPIAWERSFGRAMVGDLGGRFCKGPGGQAALEALAQKIAPGDGDIRIHVINIPIVNAVALPGGDILVFDKLLKEAQSADEVAGVVGHEAGHVEKRHVMQALVREAGLGILLGGFHGNAGGTLNTLVSTSYSRSAESEADGYAIEAMRKAAISPQGTADFFRRLAKLEGALGGAGEALSYISTHPASRARAERFEASAVKGRITTPALDAAQWKALVGICRNDPARRNDSAFPIF